MKKMGRKDGDADADVGVVGQHVGAVAGRAGPRTHDRAGAVASGDILRRARPPGGVQEVEAGPVRHAGGARLLHRPVLRAIGAGIDRLEPFAKQARFSASRTAAAQTAQQGFGRARG